jgi:hypothetical protein
LASDIAELDFTFTPLHNPANFDGRARRERSETTARRSEDDELRGPHRDSRGRVAQTLAAALSVAVATPVCSYR